MKPLMLPSHCLNGGACCLGIYLFTHKETAVQATSHLTLDRQFCLAAQQTQNILWRTGSWMCRVIQKHIISRTKILLPVQKLFPHPLSQVRVNNNTCILTGNLAITETTAANPSTPPPPLSSQVRWIRKLFFKEETAISWKMTHKLFVDEHSSLTDMA